MCERCGSYACVDCMPGSARQCSSCEQISGDTRYHVVPVWRFLLMTAISLGFYPNYWMYKTWAKVKVADRSDIWPIPRGVFSRFTYFSLITDLNVYNATRSSQLGPLNQAWAVGYFLGTATYRLPGAAAFLGIFNVLFMLPAVNRIWVLSGDKARANAKWGLRHTLVSIFGALFTGMVLFGLSLSGHEK
jgi:hypothetical protein